MRPNNMNDASIDLLLSFRVKKMQRAKSGSSLKVIKLLPIQIVQTWMFGVDIL
jgi:hypothetical protein